MKKEFVCLGRRSREMIQITDEEKPFSGPTSQTRFEIWKMGIQTTARSWAFFLDKWRHSCPRCCNMKHYHSRKKVVKTAFQSKGPVQRNSGFQAWSSRKMKKWNGQEIDLEARKNLQEIDFYDDAWPISNHKKILIGRLDPIETLSFQKNASEINVSIQGTGQEKSRISSSELQKNEKLKSISQHHRCCNTKHGHRKKEIVKSAFQYKSVDWKKTYSICLSRGIFGKRKGASIQLSQIHEKKREILRRDCLLQTHSLLIPRQEAQRERGIWICSTRRKVWFSTTIVCCCFLHSWAGFILRRRKKRKWWEDSNTKSIQFNLII